MAIYKIALEPDKKTYRLVKVTGTRLIVVAPLPRLIKQACCNSPDDIMSLEDHDVKYSHDYDK